jgi:hypothetical protein
MALDRPPVTLSLRYEEVLVRADLLARWDRDGTTGLLPFEDPAEPRVLWDLAACRLPGAWDHLRWGRFKGSAQQLGELTNVW